MTGWETGLYSAYTHTNTNRYTDVCTHAHKFAGCICSSCGHKLIFSPMLLENPCDSTHAVQAEQTCWTKKTNRGWGMEGSSLISTDKSPPVFDQISMSKSMTSHQFYQVKSFNIFKMGKQDKQWQKQKKIKDNLRTAREWGWIKNNLSRARGSKGRGVVLLSLWAAGILSYSAYICESCYWCNCIEVLATICSPLGGPGSSRRQWSGYVQHITAADVLAEKKLPFQIFPTAANKIQMLDWSCFGLAHSPLPPPSLLPLHLLSFYISPLPPFSLLSFLHC